MSPPITWILFSSPVFYHAFFVNSLLFIFLISFSPQYVLSDGSLFLDIGADASIASALAALYPAVRITTIRLYFLKIYVVLINLASVCGKFALSYNFSLLQAIPVTHMKCLQHEFSNNLLLSLLRESLQTSFVSIIRILR